MEEGLWIASFVGQRHGEDLYHTLSTSTNDGNSKDDKVEPSLGTHHESRVKWMHPQHQQQNIGRTNERTNERTNRRRSTFATSLFCEGTEKKG
jgi:hypothetical protein